MTRSRREGSLEVLNSLPARMALARWRAVAKATCADEGGEDAGCASARSASRWASALVIRAVRFSPEREFGGGERIADPCIVRVEGDAIGEGDVLVGADLCIVTGGGVLRAGCGEGAKRLQMAGVIREGGRLQLEFGDGGLGCVSMKGRGRQEGADCGDGKTGPNYAGSGDVVPSATGLAGAPRARSMRNSMSKPSWRTRSSK